MRIYGTYGIHTVLLKNNVEMIFIDDAHVRICNNNCFNITNFIKEIYDENDIILLELPDENICKNNICKCGQKTISYLNDDMSFSDIYRNFPNAVCVDYRGIFPTYYLTNYEVESLNKVKHTNDLLQLRQPIDLDFPLEVYIYMILQQLGRIEPLDVDDFIYKDNLMNDILNLINYDNKINYDNNFLVNYYIKYSKIIKYLYISKPIIFLMKNSLIDDIFNKEIINRLLFIYNNTLKLINLIIRKNLTYEEMAYSKNNEIVIHKNNIPIFRFSDPIMNYVSVNIILDLLQNYEDYNLQNNKIIMVCGNSHTKNIIETLYKLNLVIDIVNYNNVGYENFNLIDPTVSIGQIDANGIAHNASDSTIIPYVEI